MKRIKPFKRLKINDFMCIYLCTEETQRRAQALEDIQRHLEEEHALQMSLLLAEQEKEQQRLCLVSIWNHTISILNRSR